MHQRFAGHLDFLVVHREDTKQKRRTKLITNRIEINMTATQGVSAVD